MSLQSLGEIFMSYLISFIIALFLTIFNLNESYASKCNHLIEGRITAKMVDNFKALHRSDDFQDEQSKVCFNSDSGDFEAGLQLSKFLSEKGFNTHISEGDSCFGACAIAFLGGSMFVETQGRLYRNRSMHYSAKLGFSAPPLSATENPSERQSSYMNSLELISRLLDQYAAVKLPDSGIRSLGWKIDPWLLKSILRHHNSKYLVIDSVGKAARLHIEVLGVIDPIEPTFKGEHIKNMCFNHLNLFFHPVDYSKEYQYQIDQWGKVNIKALRAKRYWKFPMGSTKLNVPNCAIVYQDNQFLGSTAWDNPDNWGHSRMRWYTRYPASTSLIDLPMLVSNDR